MRKIITTLIITLTAGIIFTGIVLAETGTVNVPELNFRENASTSANTLGVLNNGTKVEIISEQGDWYKIRYNNKEGYVSKQYVKKDVSNNNTNNSNNVNNTTNTTSESNTTNNTTSNNPTTTENPINPTDISELNKTTIKQETEMYVLPLLNATKLGKINVGTKVLLISVNGDWAYIQTETQNAWVIAKNLESTIITLASNIGTQIPDQNSGTSTEPNEPTTNTTTQNETTNTTLQNETITSTTTPEPTSTPTPTDNNSSTYPTTMYVNVDAVNIRKEPNTTSSIVTSAGKNVPVRVTAKEGDWYKVETSDGNGYIKAEFLSRTK